MERELHGVTELFSAAGIEVPTADAPVGASRVRLPDDSPEEPRQHNSDSCHFCSTNPPWEEATLPGETFLDEDSWLDEDF